MVVKQDDKPKRKQIERNKLAIIPRPVMERTSDEEIAFYVNQFKGKRYPDYEEKLCHAARFWIITRLLDLHEGISSRQLSKHFNMSRKIFEKKNRLNLKNDPKYYNYLSPGEANTRSRASTIRIYGREVDKLDYGIKEITSDSKITEFQPVGKVEKI